MSLLASVAVTAAPTLPPPAVFSATSRVTVVLANAGVALTTLPSTLWPASADRPACSRPAPAAVESLSVAPFTVVTRNDPICVTNGVTATPSVSVSACTTA